MKANPPGRPHTLDTEVMSRIINAIPYVIIPNQVAAMARVPKQTLSDWLIRGEKDFEAGIDTMYAQLSDNFKLEQSKIVMHTLDKLRSCPRNYQALIWILERCFRKDFSAESEDIKELIRHVETLLQHRHGGLTNEINPESYQERLEENGKKNREEGSDARH